ncbi:secondary thiamine-phosphate synthase enzyme YjbQ [Thiocystis violacea]|uniref:secondary thiamine-phosphate synthase enzyme YjbQ n=1 Tax=Thiocystis violacea TaxID=13725 RepID=UPI001903CCB4|nr:secondary thiamine-phosphate synthase enzyme YjbQ [Thiocystis violacea]MBK1718970.1 secondary thiamine-phosphate synthase [Thiocystis violacea]
MIVQQTLSLQTRGRGTYDITQEVCRRVRDSGLRLGLCHVFVQHTSASLVLCENADPTVRRDLEAFMARLVPDGDRLFDHTDEGPDDMPAHLRAILTNMDLTVPIHDGDCRLGTWQGIYLYEHRAHPHQRRVACTMIGE